MLIRLKKALVALAALALGAPLLGLALIAVVVGLLDRTNGSLVSGDEEREHLLYVPESYDATSPAPLVISMHGAALWPALQESITGWSELADDHGFIVAYPSGSGFPRVWHTFPGSVRRDIQFISDLIDTLEVRYSIDAERVYVSGFSNGGAMAFALSCALSERIAAVGTVAAAHSLPSGWCEEPAPVPLISFHGTADPLVPYDGGASWASPDAFPGVREWTQAWAERNGCGAAFEEEAVSSDVTRLNYVDCPLAPVTLYTVHEGGHTWPGGKPLPEWLAGPTSRSVSASRQMWEFFRRHALSGA